MRAMFVSSALLAVAALGAGHAFAAPVAIEVLLKPQEQVRFEFADESKHFVLALKREGRAEGSGAFAGAAVTEIGWHDIRPGISAEPQGYLQVRAENGDIAVLQWRVKAVFTKGDGKPALFNQGVWELFSGTGQFANQRGVGSLTIRPQPEGESIFVLDGEVAESSS